MLHARAAARGPLITLLAMSCGTALGQGVGASAGGVGAAGGPGYSASEILPPGATIASTEIELSGLPAGADEAGLRQALRDALAFGRGDAWDAVLGAAALGRVRAVTGVMSAQLASRLSRDGLGNHLVLRVRVGAEEETPKHRIGAPSFPVLYRDGERYLKVELSGGHGVFSDGNPWFGKAEIFTAGNPMVEDPSVGANTGERATWAESLLQAGFAGVMPLGEGGLYGFGAVTGIGVVSYGQDIFRDSARSSLDLEKAYAGLLYAPADTDLRLRLSLGRQNYSLNSGFLVSQFGSQWNAGPRPGVYLAPRTTQDRSLLASASFRGWKATFFSLDPNELESIESDTCLQGLNLAAAPVGRWSWDVSALHVPESRTAYRAPDGLRRGREGLWTAAGHLRMRSKPQEPGFWFESELAHQWHDEFSMDAWAGYAELGFYDRDRRWTPSLSYRYAAFTGDDPATPAYERFDTLYSGGLDHWLQGISINKLLTQANRLTHRLRLNVTPTPRLDLTFDAYRHTAEKRNNLGANPALDTLASRDLGEELQLTARWQLRPDVLVLGIASTAFAGEAIDVAAGGEADSWNTLQVQIFWGF